MSLEGYRQRVKDLINSMDGGVIMNNDREHAAIIVESIFEYSFSEIIIFSGWLDQTFYGRPEIVESAQQFLEQEGTVLRVLVEERRSDSYWGGHEFISNVPNSRLEVKHIQYQGEEEELPFNFAVGDGRLIRYEVDKRQTSAIGIFGNIETGDRLKEIFEAYWSDASPILGADIAQAA